MKAVKSLGTTEPPLTKVVDVAKPVITEDEILVKTVAMAANPTDWKHVVFYNKKGTVGTDASGVVEEVGGKVKGFKKGDIVSSFARGTVDERSGTFAEYYVTRPEVTLKYSEFEPDTVLGVGENGVSKLTNFDAAATVTLGLVTVGLSFNHSLGIKPEDRGEWILIWGGATATGVLAIQVAKLVYGLKVATTASPKNFEFLKSLGADEVFDYSDEEIVHKISKLNYKFALDTVGTTKTFQQVYDGSGSKTAVIDNLLSLNPDKINIKENETIKFTVTLAYTALHDVSGLPGGAPVPSEPLYSEFKDFWYRLLPPFLSQLRSTRPLVLEPGLESAEEALLLLKDDKVSGQKVVFRVK